MARKPICALPCRVPLVRTLVLLVQDLGSLMEASGDTREVKWTPEQVFRVHAPRVYNLARRMLGNDADAEDVTQDVLLQVVRKLDTFRGEASLGTWLHKITAHAALAQRRRRAQREQREHHD